MWEDQIVAEVRQIRQAHAARFNYDLRAIVEDLRRQEQKSERKFIKLAPKRPERYLKKPAFEKIGRLSEVSNEL